jgi:UDP-2-acetamido-3-amino-2,3-dideoxy-glucuronate N-acetyltransferase
MYKMSLRGRAWIHNTCEISPDAKIGEETRIWRNSCVRTATIGKNCQLGQGVYIDQGVVIGDGVKIQNNVSVFTGVTIEDDAFIGPNVTFTNVLNPRAWINRHDEFLPTVIKKGASIGAGAVILCGITLGEYSMIGAGAVITDSITPYTLAYNDKIKALRKKIICKNGCLSGVSRGQGQMLVCLECNDIYEIDGSDIYPINVKDGKVIHDPIV